jgi:hypothetical protein
VTDWKIEIRDLAHLFTDGRAFLTIGRDRIGFASLREAHEGGGPDRRTRRARCGERQLYFRRDAGGRWMLELRGTSTVPAGTRVHLIGTYVAPRIVAVQELTASA